MWKVVLLLLAVFILGHFAVRYIRSNPLDPEIVDSEVVVESEDFQVRFQRTGEVAGTYFLADAKDTDLSSQPVNARLQVFGMQSGNEYMHVFPDFHVYGTESSQRLAGTATPLALIAADRKTYGDLRELLGDLTERQANKGERLCVVLSGEALFLSSAESLDDGHDVTAMLEKQNSDPIVWVDSLDVKDCRELLAAGQR
jgi:hypothetical protein